MSAASAPARRRLRATPARRTPQFTCFTGAKMQILTQKTAGDTCATHSSVYLLYWYKNANTDAEDGGRHLRDELLPTFVCTHTHSKRARAGAMERMLQRPPASVFVRLYQFKNWYFCTSEQASCYFFFWKRNGDVERMLRRPSASVFVRLYQFTGTFVPVASKVRTSTLTPP